MKLGMSHELSVVKHFARVFVHYGECLVHIVFNAFDPPRELS